MTTHARYPVQLEGRLDEPLSRGLWLVKWLLLIPHWLILIVLWFAFSVVDLVALFAILFTGRYPRSMFDFNVGVLRWTWRVFFYSYHVLGTDRYPPFSLYTIADYPADLHVDYPEKLSRGLVLVKWWLLAIPQLIIVGILTGGLHLYWVNMLGAGLVGFLVLVAAVLILFTKKYPKPLFDFIMGLNRWIFRVAVYVSLMRDEYPPFRLDSGPTEPEEQS